MTDEEILRQDEAWWLGCALSYDLLDYLRARTRGRPDPRRMRLVSCACCREIWELLTDPRSRTVVEVAERHADLSVSPEEFASACDDATFAAHALTRAPFKDAARAAQYALAKDDQAWLGATGTCSHASQARAKAATKKASAREVHLAAAHARQTHLVRDIFGNPFRPLHVTPVLQDPSLVQLARQAYETRLLPSGELDPNRISELANALEAAGAEAPLVAHLRGSGGHFRGCWAVDLVLGREATLPDLPPQTPPSLASSTQVNEYAPCFGGRNDDGTWSLGFTDFAGTAEVFEEMGHEGGGYGWHGVVDSLVRLKAPKLRRNLRYDPEGSMFVVLCKNEAALRQVADLIRTAIADPALLREAIEKANPDLMEG